MLRVRIGPTFLLVAAAVIAGTLESQSASSPPAQHVFFRVQLAPSAQGPLSGRLLIFLKNGTGDKVVDVDEFHPGATAVAAREVHDLAPGQSLEINADETSYPQAFSTMPPGDYEVQAALDVNHTYNYSGRGVQDWISGVVPLAHWTPAVGATPSLTLDRHPPEGPRRDLVGKAMENAKPGVAQKEELVSPSLSRFWGRPIAIRAWVILPPDYASEAQGQYPTVYWTHGFGGSLDYCLLSGMAIRDRMQKRKMPPMIWVMLDESIPQGTHEFADSVNNGPWGTALTTEFLPYLEHKYRMDARQSGRFLNGHSSGGWATLQLQINYPKTFGGTWSTSPDSSDFHDFTGPDLYRSGANIYVKPDGAPWPIMREGGKVVSTLEQFAKLEQVLGPYGGQISSFDWVFSPKGDDGAPEPMFDRKTGEVNAEVVAYWRAHYDLSHLVETNWAARGRDLKGKIHLLVGTADTFYLDGAAHLFEATLDRLGAQPHFSYLQDKTHFDLYAVGEDRQALFDRISAEMYAVARPAKNWKQK